MIILCMGSDNERRRDIVTSSLIGWDHIQNDPGFLLDVCDLIARIPQGIKAILSVP